MIHADVALSFPCFPTSSYCIYVHMYMYSVCVPFTQMHSGSSEESIHENEVKLMHPVEVCTVYVIRSGGEEIRGGGWMYTCMYMYMYMYMYIYTYVGEPINHVSSTINSVWYLCRLLYMYLCSAFMSWLSMLTCLPYRLRLRMWTQRRLRKHRRESSMYIVPTTASLDL